MKRKTSKRSRTKKKTRRTHVLKKPVVISNNPNGFIWFIYILLLVAVMAIFVLMITTFIGESDSSNSTPTPTL